MSKPTAADLLPEACTSVATVIRAASGADLSATTSCAEFSLQELLTHFTATAGALVYAGKTRSLDADNRVCPINGVGVQLCSTLNVNVGTVTAAGVVAAACIR
jgi:hypothetical protein